jgi:NADPH2:quinone reductase
MEISGVVERCGEEVGEVSAGSRVVAVPIFGGHAETVVCAASRVFPVPDGADLVEAAAFPVTFLTAHHAIREARVRPGDRVVVTAAAGGVGTALLQLLRRRGARVLALAGSESKLALCRELGADRAAVYADAPAALSDSFGGKADVAIDAIGGATFRLLWRSLAAGGRYVLYGFAAAAGSRGLSRLRALRGLAAMGLFSPFSFVSSCRTLIGFNLSLLPDRAGELREAAGELLAEWRAGRLRAIVGERFSFERLPDAHRALASRATSGKVLVVTSPVD